MNVSSASNIDGMVIDWDVPITMGDGIVLRADVFRPAEDGNYPTIMSMGPYAKGLAFQEGFPSNWNRMVTAYPEITDGTSNAYQNWEVVDPEKWVPDGYVCVRVDSRGAGRSPGVLDIYSPREASDFYQCIEWGAEQSWSNGKIGLLGISYYAMNQWHVAALQPPHLSAICVWEGAADYYRDMARHGGILCEFVQSWFPRQVVSVQHGVGERGRKSRVTGEFVAGPETLSEQELASNRSDPAQELADRPLLDKHYRDRTADLSKITVPLLSSGNWGGQGLHPRGNLEGYLGAASPQKWLEMHGNTHFSPFYTDRGIALQKQFFGHFLKGEDTGWTKRPPIELQVRHPGEKFVARAEQEWPLARTQWTKYYLDPVRHRLGTEPGSGPDLRYDATSESLTFSTPPLTDDLEITGPVAARLTLSSHTTDADVFLTLRVFTPDDEEVLFIGSNDPQVPVSVGWLRASHRKLDPNRSLPYRPLHTHDEPWPLEPGSPVELDIEIWPTCIVVPKGYRVSLTISGQDYEHEPTVLPDAMYPMKGVGPFLHNHPQDRPAEVFGGTNTLHFSQGEAPYLLLPIIP